MLWQKNPKMQNHLIPHHTKSAGWAESVRLWVTCVLCVALHPVCGLCTFNHWIKPESVSLWLHQRPQPIGKNLLRQKPSLWDEIYLLRRVRTGLEVSATVNGRLPGMTVYGTLSDIHWKSLTGRSRTGTEIQSVSPVLTT